MKSIKLKLITFYNLTFFINAFIIINLIPLLLGYDSNVFNTIFNTSFADGSIYFLNIIALTIITSLIITIMSINLLQDIDNYKKYKAAFTETKKAIYSSKIRNIKKTCLNFPNILSVVLFFIPMLFEIIFILVKSSFTIYDFKLALMILITSNISATIINVYSRKHFAKILINLENKEISKNIKSISTKLMLQIIPLISAGIIFTFLLLTIIFEKTTGTIYNTETLIYMFISLILMVIPLYAILIFYIKTLDKEISLITSSFKKIHSRKSLYKELYVTSNDELGQLIYEYNTIITILKDYIDKIEDSQEKLVERESLSSLGQLIGGVAHNLKTPIMSIAGAVEGLDILLDEYKDSIGDSQVTIEDHHEIANDMHTWLEKIKNYVEYMSDAINAVKGQAVTYSEDDNNTFTIDEFLKHVQILMSHELKKSQTTLNIKSAIDLSTNCKGNVNSLVQIINNMISNSIEAYNTMNIENKIINLNIYYEGSNMVISLEDFAGGIPRNVQKKLFKEMITTKGKNGTGIGLYMSYTNIRAQFGGKIDFKCQDGKGTTFYISIPN